MDRHKRLMNIFRDKEAPTRLRILAHLLRNGFTLDRTLINGIHEDLGVTPLGFSEVLTRMNLDHGKLRW